MLHFRNTYKNCKIMLLYMVLAILFLMFATIALLFSFIPEFRVLGIALCVVFNLLFIFNFFLLCMKNNNYKLRFFIKLGSFNKEFKKFEKLCKGNKKTIKAIKKQQKDSFLQFGEDYFSDQLFKPEKNNWNNWIEEANAFYYGCSGYMEKLSFLTYVLYNSCAGGGGLEEFFRCILEEPFSVEEIKEIIDKSEFFSKKFRNFIINIVEEFDVEKEDELFQKYEFKDNQIFFTFEREIFDCANWIAYNRVLLSSCVGVYLHGNVEHNIYRLFLSNDYKRVVYVYSDDEKSFKVDSVQWSEADVCWNVVKDATIESIYVSDEDAVKKIFKLTDYIEVEI